MCPITVRRIWKTAARIRTVSHSYVLHISHITYARTKPNNFYRNKYAFCRLRFQTRILKNNDLSCTDKDFRTLGNAFPKTCKKYRTLLFATKFRGNFLQLEFISECVNLYMNRPMCLTKMNFHTTALVILLYVILCINKRNITTYHDKYQSMEIKMSSCRKRLLREKLVLLKSYSYISMMCSLCQKSNDASKMHQNQCVFFSNQLHTLYYLFTPWSRVLLEKLTSKLCR